MLVIERRHTPSKRDHEYIIIEGKRLNHIRFIGDTLIISDNQLKYASEKVDPKTNVSKIKIIIIHNNRD